MVSKVPDDFFEPIELDEKTKDKLKTKEWTEQEWADHLKKVEGEINDDFQDWKKEKDGETSRGRILIDFKDAYKKIKKQIEKIRNTDSNEFDFMKALFSQIISLITFLLPVISKFTPIGNVGYAIVAGLRILKLFLNRRLVRRMKMDLKTLNKDTAEIAIFGCEMLNGIGMSLEDNEFSLGDAMNFKNALVALPAAVQGATDAVFPEGEALTELVELVKVKFDIPQDNAEKLAEQGLSIGLAIWNAYKAYKK